MFQMKLQFKHVKVLVAIMVGLVAGICDRRDGGPVPAELVLHI